MNNSRQVQGYKFTFHRRNRHGSIIVTRSNNPVNYACPSEISDKEFDAWVSGFLAGRDKGWGAVV